MDQTIGLVICNNYYEEFKAVLKFLPYKNVQVFGISTTCLNKNQAEKDRLNNQIKAAESQVTDLKILIPESCLSCASECMPEKCEKCDHHKSCIELFITKSFYNQLITDGYYIITTGWLLNWEKTVKDSWQISGETAKDFFANSVRSICVLNTGIAIDFQNSLEEFSQFAGLDYKIIDIGLDYFQLKIENLLNSFFLKLEQAKAKVAYKKVADYTMAFEMIRDLSTNTSEKDLLHNIFQLFNLLFSPQKMQYTPVHDGEKGNVEQYNTNSLFSSGKLRKKTQMPYFELLESKKGFKINASYDNEILGYLEIDEVQFSEHINSYIALINSISSVLGLMIYNSRQYGKILKEKIEILTKSEHHLKQKNQELQDLYMELQVSEEEIRVSNEELRLAAEDLLRTNQELDFARKKAEESDRLKTAFLHNMSHEIRTPLNAILGFSDILTLNFENKAKLIEYTEIIKTRGYDLLGIIDEILDIAKIESNQMAIHLEPCNIGIVLSEVEVFFTEYQKQIKKEHILFKCHNPYKNNPLSVNTDPLKLK